jgi:hypothetical protein
MTIRKHKIIVPTLVALLLQLTVPSLVEVAMAAPPQFTQAYVRPDRHKELIATGTLVCATPSAASTGVTEATVKVTFPTQTVGTDFVVNATAANWIVDSNDLPAGSTFWAGMTSGTTAASNVTGHTVTFPSGDLTAGTQYCFHITGTSTLTNGSAGASSGIVGATLITRTSAPADINQTNWATALITDDQIVVSAVVPPNFSITLNGNTDAFPSNLDPAVISSTGGRTVTITTNAVGGWIAWVKDSSTPSGLYSATANYTIPTTGTINGAPNDLTAGTEGYVLDVDLTTDFLNGCGLLLDAEYNSATGIGGGTLSNSFQPMAACTRAAGPFPAAPGTSDGDVITLIERAAIRGGTPAGSDYTDVLTIVGAGNF